MSLAELKLLAQLESRQKNVNKKLQNIVKEETTKRADEPYLIETEPENISQLQLPSFDELKENLSEQQLNEIVQHIKNVIMPKVEEELRMNIENHKQQTLPIYTSQIPYEQEYSYPVPLISDAEINSYVDRADPKDRKDMIRSLFKENNERSRFNEFMKSRPDSLEESISEYFQQVLRDESIKYVDDYVKKQQIENYSLNIAGGRTERLPNESDDQYIERLESINLSLPDSNTIIELNKNKEKQKLKKNLQSLMKFSDVEAVINDPFLTDDKIKLLNIIFPKFNKEIRDTFKSIDLQTFKDFTINYLNKIQTKTLNDINVDKYSTRGDLAGFEYSIPEDFLESIDLNEEYEPYKFGDLYVNSKEDDIQKEYFDRFNLNYIPPTSRSDVTPLLGTQELRLMKKGDSDDGMNSDSDIDPVEAQAQYALPPPIQLQPIKLSQSQRNADYYTYLDKKYKDVGGLRNKLAEFQSADNPYSEYFSNVSTKKQGARGDNSKNRTKQEIQKSIASRLVDIQNQSGLEPDQIGWGFQKTKGKKQRHKTFYGKGLLLPDDHEERFYNFGKFLLDNDKLNNNVVRIIYKKTGINHPQLKTTIVSDDFIDILQDVVNNSKFNERAYKKLEKEERDFMKSLIEKSGVNKILKIKDLDDDEEKSLKNRLVVIQGELEIGNNSPILKKEASEIILHFMKNGKIRENVGYKMLYNLVQ
jgi:hypothetical protein